MSNETTEAAHAVMARNAAVAAWKAKMQRRTEALNGIVCEAAELVERWDEQGSCLVIQTQIEALKRALAQYE